MGSTAGIAVVALLLNVAACSQVWTAAEKKKLLDLHNQARQNVSVLVDRHGNTPGGVPVNMRKIEWDINLELAAQEVADTCEKNHIYPDTEYMWISRVSHRNYQMGQNIAGIGGLPAHGPADFAFNGWFYKELGWYSWADRSCLSGTTEENCRHLEQVLWADTAYMGCGFKADCPRDSGAGTRTSIVCHYMQPGVMSGEEPFALDKTSTSAVCNAGSKQDCDYSNLCARETCADPRDYLNKEAKRAFPNENHCSQLLVEGTIDCDSHATPARTLALGWCPQTCGFTDFDGEIPCWNTIGQSKCTRRFNNGVFTCDASHPNDFYRKCAAFCDNCDAIRDRISQYQGRLSWEFNVDVSKIGDNKSGGDGGIVAGSGTCPCI